MAPNFVLGSSQSSTYREGYACGFESPAASLDDHCECPVAARRVPFQRSVLCFLLMAVSMTILVTAGICRAETTLKSGGSALTWEQAIRTAVERQPLIKVAEHEALESRALGKQIESANYPQIAGIWANSGGNTRVLANLGISGSLPKPTNYLTSPGVRVDYLITDFRQTAHRILSQKAFVASAEKAVLTSKALAILQVEQAYLNCLKQQRLVDIANEVLKERDLIRQQTEAFYRRQLRSKLDLDFASVEFNGLRCC